MPNPEKPRKRSRSKFTDEAPFRLHSTNSLERLDGEINRCTNVVEILPNDAALTWLVGTILAEQDYEWAAQSQVRVRDRGSRWIDAGRKVEGRESCRG
ncbi:MAG: hypothetical protein F4153_03710 [Acidimicrobiia bacterium]|nr:hypothetical protein [Acidimicrobiia bacterium]